MFSEPDSSDSVGGVFDAFTGRLRHRAGTPACDWRASLLSKVGYVTANNRNARGYLPDHVTGYVNRSSRLKHFCSGGWLVESSMPGKHGVHFDDNRPGAWNASPLLDHDQTSYLSLGDILQHLFIKAEIGHKLFQLFVFFLKLLQSS